MSIATVGEKQMETATFRASSPAGSTDALVVMQATEDREIHFVQCEAQTNVIPEIGFNSQGQFLTANTDETASGVLYIERSGANPFYNYSSAPPIWNAGEEVNVHTDNATGGPTIIVGVIGYVPVGEFHRSRLRNR